MFAALAYVGLQKGVQDSIEAQVNAMSNAEFVGPNTPGLGKSRAPQRWDDLDESFTQGSHGVKSPLSLIPPVQGNRQDR